MNKLVRSGFLLVSWCAVSAHFAGFAAHQLFYLSSSDGETVAFLHYLLAVPAYQGMHIGDELMKQIMSCFESLLYVKVMPSDPKTISFYERYGFQTQDLDIRLRLGDDI